MRIRAQRLLFSWRQQRGSPSLSGLGAIAGCGAIQLSSCSLGRQRKAVKSERPSWVGKGKEGLGRVIIRYGVRRQGILFSRDSSLSSNWNMYFDLDHTRKGNGANGIKIKV
ncbi:hypothetical protein BKA67DRAFT_276639 [Truncatella angustata]|uniref:Uncharacterized protein n=1 Tax=Truncatella angustata TaxID=152316 RepID=A0A9P8UKT6_9PEZI|nr:uncharacterized protein BKA67DRAFT_276639 [Truncatella angustata]KAH6654370.1 hypothetical protein BKA67DRAFT_276639 [Truncatella angustata]